MLALDEHPTSSPDRVSYRRKTVVDKNLRATLRHNRRNRQPSVSRADHRDSITVNAHTFSPFGNQRSDISHLRDCDNPERKMTHSRLVINCNDADASCQAKKDVAASNRRHAAFAWMTARTNSVAIAVLNAGMR